MRANRVGSIPEHLFDEEPAERRASVISKRASETKEALARTREARRRTLEDPKIRKRSREVLEEIERGDEPTNPGIAAEELPDFLREHNR